MIELRIAAGCAPTARVLQRLIEAEGCRVGPGGNPVSWGVPLARGLNRNASRLNKYDQLVQLHHARIRVPDTILNGGEPTVNDPIAAHDGVYLARKFRHHGGTDIMPVLQFEDFAARRAAGAEYFTRYIPLQREFRVWIYRRRHLGSYEKVMRYPARYTRIGRNFDNGFAFSLLTEVQIPRDAVEMASRAVDALGLDFGAVDIILGKDGQYYVLEVNSAPGVEGEDRQVIRSLARRIAKWDRLGCPRRNGDQDATSQQAPLQPSQQAPQVAPPRPSRPLERRSWR